MARSVAAGAQVGRSPGWRPGVRRGSAAESEDGECDDDGGPETEHPLEKVALELPQSLGDLLTQRVPKGGDLRVEPCPAHKPLGLELGDALLELGVERGPLRAPFRIELGEPLLELGVEAREVELVYLSEIGPVGRVHSVEPIHELVGDVLAES